MGDDGVVGQMGERGADEQERAGGVGLEQLAPVLRRGVGHHYQRHARRCIHDHVDTAERARGVVDDAPAVLGEPYVAHHRDAAAGRRDRLLEPVGPACREHHLGAVSYRVMGDRSTDTRRRPDHEHPAPGQRCRHARTPLVQPLYSGYFMHVYDYVIVGGGSAGCALAGRLTENGRHRVVLLEAGPADWSPYIHVPAGLMKLKSQYFTYQDEPDETRDGMNTTWLTGRILGGGSSVNGLVWVRGNPADFDRWAELGAKGWDYESLLPYFKRGESFEGGADAYRGGAGPQRVSLGRTPHVLSDAFIAAAQHAGHPLNADYNGASQDGVSVVQTSQRRGFRHSAATAYLGVLRRRRNLDIRTNASATRVLFEGTRAVGVRYERKGTTHEVRATREVIISAGTLASPKLLMLSGVGPADQLRPQGVEVLADRPGVGRNLQDHLMLIMMWNVDVPTLNNALTPKGIVQHGLDFVLRGRGPAASAAAHALVFLQLDRSSRAPEIELLFAPLGMIGENTDESLAETFDTVGEHKANELKLVERSMASAIVQMLHPRARGTVELRSADPADPPVIRHHFLEHPEDAHDLIAGAREARKIVANEPLARHVRSEAFPGPAVTTDDEWAAFVKGAAWGGQHPVGTCRMGDDPESVVDPELRVRGVEGLRVIDASVMPELTSGNINAVCQMIGERGAEFVLGSV